MGQRDDGAPRAAVGAAAPRPPGKAHRDRHDSLVPADAPEVDPDRSVTIEVPPGPEPREVFATLPASIAPKPGKFGQFVVYATQSVELEACAVVPLSDEIPPPPPEPWTPKPGDDGDATP